MRDALLQIAAKQTELSEHTDSVKLTDFLGFSLKEGASYPLLNFLKGGLMTLRLLTTQCRPTRTLARSPRMMQSFITIVCRRTDRQTRSLCYPCWQLLRKLMPRPPARLPYFRDDSFSQKKTDNKAKLQESEPPAALLAMIRARLRHRTERRRVSDAAGSAGTAGTGRGHGSSPCR